ncbi:MAG: aromatic amino acid transaminase [Maricaulaceae bacterium]
MFEALTARPPDAIMALMEMCKADTNPNKIDLGVGVYKTGDGATPIMRAVKTAEQLWWNEEETKTYVSTTGNADFRAHMLSLILGDDIIASRRDRIASSQAAGGSGALRMGADILYAANPDATVWVSTPTWANHIPLISSAGFELKKYPYYDRETMGVDFDAMMSCLKNNTKAGDIVVLHGCCHNPTGADLSDAQWDQVADLLAEKQIMPFIDLAYFGLGRGLVDDTYGLRRIIDTSPEMIFAASCSKNFALYRERVGLVAMICKDTDTAKIAQSQLGSIQRRMISMPPDHGAALVARILGDDDLKKIWSDELTEMRLRINSLREQLSDALNVQGGEVIAAAIKNQIGMFSMLPLSEAQAIRLREEFSVYVTNSGRMNMAGTSNQNIPRLAESILAVL